MHFCLMSLSGFSGLSSKIGAARMNIRFVSTLTAEDEANFAPALLRAVGSLLDQLPIAYTVRIETSGDAFDLGPHIIVNH